MYYLVEKYGEEKWDKIRECVGINDYMFIIYKCYSESMMQKIVDVSGEVFGEEMYMMSDDFMQFFGSCFVKFFSYYGYDCIICVSGWYLWDFLIGIDNLYEYMWFGY